MWYENPFDSYGNFIYNTGMFISGQVDILGWRNDFEDEFLF